VNVLVVSPHPDDESIGCGGAIATHAAGGDRVMVLWLTSGEAGAGEDDPDRARAVREAESLAAAEVLGVAQHNFLRLPDGGLETAVPAAAQAISGMIDDLDPEIVYAPHALEDHSDHVAAFHAARDGIAASKTGSILYCYEVWTPLTWFDVVLPIDDQIGRKLDAVACYRSQLERFHFDRAVEGLAAYRGALAGGCAYAEVFSCPEGEAVPIVKTNENPIGAAL
jgi:LmbE family N-acetylglucosaminyl deacetylase